jgi:aryl-alcohol dehydrogenase-like predicted oxidoreductase
MKYRTLGTSPLVVSSICLGTMMFGDRTDAKEAADIVRAAQEAGINFIDTADVYSLGASERMLAPLIQSARHHWIVASKVGNSMAGPNEKRPHNVSGYSRKWMAEALDASLARLQTDYLDLYYLHRDFDTPPVGIRSASGMAPSLEEPVRAMGDAIRAGKVRAWGLSNFRGWRIAEVVRLCRELGVPLPAACQPYYNALNRMPEVEILPACLHYGIGVVPYSPVARGVLSGKYQPGVAPDSTSRAGRNDKRIMQTEFRAESLVIAQDVVAHAQSRGLTPTQWACAWVLANRTVTSVIAGPRTLSQWTEYFAAPDYRWTEGDEAFMESRVPTGHPSTPGYSDPAYPVIGRQAVFT